MIGCKTLKYISDYTQQKRTVSNRAVSFIENKLIDYEKLADVLSESARVNHWANFGPVSQLLEELLCDVLEISESKSVVLCKSGTEALHTIIRLHESKNGRKLRWVVSAFGFISSNIGPLSDARIVDCDQEGMLSLASLKKLDVDAWDGLVFTNTFGLCRDIKPFRDYCLLHNKIFVSDSAVALLTDTRKIENAPDEALSFHQTKPWGMAEGGGAIIDKSDESAFRDLLNFGIESSLEHRQYSLNGKLADINCALILQRIAAIDSWWPSYCEQIERIIPLAEDYGLKLLAPYDHRIIMGHLPFLAPKSVCKDDLENEYLMLRKYYRPLAKGFDCATDIFSRIVNFPCHSQVHELSDVQLKAVFSGMLGSQK